MYMHSVKLVNYKSFGEKEDNEVILEPGVTAIIGMNESGKSNVLSGLAHVDPHFRNADGFEASLLNCNQAEDSAICYHVVLKPKPQDFENGITTDTFVYIVHDKQVVTGAFLDAFNLNIGPSVDEVFKILDANGNNPLKLNNTDGYNLYCGELRHAASIDIPLRSDAVGFLVKYANRFEGTNKEGLKLLLEIVKTKWEKLLSSLPYIFYCDSTKGLKTVYTSDEVETQLKNSTEQSESLLPEFVTLLGLTKDEFISASKPGGERQQIKSRRKIESALKNFNLQFNEFYKTEPIELYIDFNGGRVRFIVQSSDGEPLKLNERSNGLRWYINTFVAAKANAIPEENVVYLFDEPGVYLHVNAQRELIKLFAELTSQGNQVVYTTHSPYMLDTEEGGLHRIRAVVKDQEGYSHIYKTVYDSRIVPDSQHDTLAPVIQAIGMNLSDTFGPAKNKINIVTEGSSDYIYLKTMAKALGINSDHYVIIPSVGATNSVNICSILQGWGCPYIALFDYDSEGVRNGELLREKMDCELGKQYCFVKDVTQEEITAKTYKDNPYVIEDVVTREKIKEFCDARSIPKDYNKSLIAKLLANAIDEGYECGENCKRNFRAMFIRLGMCSS